MANNKELKRTTLGWMTERRDFLYVYATPSVSGQGFDVVMRIDGTYSDRDAAEEMADSMRKAMETWDCYDLPKDKRDWWYGPVGKEDERRVVQQRTRKARD